MTDERKTRKIITNDILRLARSYIEREKKMSEIAELLDISLSSAITISNKIIAGLSNEQIIVKKGRKAKDKTDLKNLIRSILLEDNSLTQSGIAERLLEFDINCSQSKISRTLDEMEVTRKRLSLVPIEKNNPAVLDARQAYGRALENISIMNLVYLDETVFNLHTTRHYGYSAKVPANRGQNISLMAAISARGVVAFELKDGAFERESFASFILANLVPYFRDNRDSILIMDNCRFHHCAEILSLLSQNNIAYKFLPAYSPQLNPIEEFFGNLKANYESIHPRPTTRNEIKERVQNLLSTRSYESVAGFEKARNLLPRAIARHEFI